MSVNVDTMKAHMWQTLWNYNDQRKEPQCSSFEDFSDCFGQILQAMDTLRLLHERYEGTNPNLGLKSEYAIETTYEQLASNWDQMINRPNLVHIWNIIVQTLRIPEAVINYHIKGQWITVTPEQFYLHQRNFPTTLRFAEYMFLQEWYEQYGGYEEKLRVLSDVVGKRLTEWVWRWQASNIISGCPTDQGVRAYLDAVFPVLVDRCVALEDDPAWKNNTFRDHGMEYEIADSRIYSHLMQSTVRDRLGLQKLDRTQLHWAVRLLALEHVGAAENLLYYVGLNYSIQTGKPVEVVFGRWGERDLYMLLIEGKLYSFGQRVGRHASEMEIKHRYNAKDALNSNVFHNRNHHASTLGNVHYSIDWFFGIESQTPAQ